MKKKILSILLAAVILISVVPLSVSAASSGTCGDNLTWSLNGNTLTISGTGAMYDYDDPDSIESTFFAPWLDYSVKENIHTLVLEEGVTGIGSYAFYSCFNLTSVKFSSSVVSIDEFAFCQCDALTSITLPSGLKSIEDGVFSGCIYLTGITIPNGVTSIGASSFQNCMDIAEITIPSGVRNIGDSAFYGCASLASIKFEGNAPTIGESAFSDVVAAAQYPENNSTWTSSVRQSYGGTIVWTSYPAGPSVPSAPTQFKDVSANAYYVDAVEWAVENRITSGTSETTFSPNSPCTRAQAVTFLWRAAGSPVIEGTTDFSDVADSAYYADAVKWAVANGITQGTGNGKFSPNATCNRAQIVTFLYRAEGSPAVSGGSNFNDVNSGDYYSAAVQWAVQNGVTQGTSADKFSPDNDCVRAQIVTFLYRAYA